MPGFITQNRNPDTVGKHHKQSSNWMSLASINMPLTPEEAMESLGTYYEKNTLIHNFFSSAVALFNCRKSPVLSQAALRNWIMLYQNALENYKKIILSIPPETSAILYRITNHSENNILLLSLNIQDKDIQLMDFTLKTCKLMKPSDLAAIFRIINNNAETFSACLINKFTKNPDDFIIKAQMQLFLEFLESLQDDQLLAVIHQRLNREEVYDVFDGLSAFFSDPARQTDNLNDLYTRIETRYYEAIQSQYEQSLGNKPVIQMRDYVSLAGSINTDNTPSTPSASASFTL